MNFKNENNNNENMNKEVELNNNKGELKMNEENNNKDTIKQAMGGAKGRDSYRLFNNNNKLNKNENITTKTNGTIQKEIKTTNKPESFTDIKFKTFNNKQLKALKELKAYRLSDEKKKEFLTANKILEGFDSIDHYKTTETNDLLGACTVNGLNFYEIIDKAPLLYKKLSKYNGQQIFKQNKTIIKRLETDYINKLIKKTETSEVLSENDKLNAIKYYKDLKKEIQVIKSYDIDIKYLIWDIYKYNRAVETYKYISQDPAEFNKFVDIISSLKYIKAHNKNFVKAIKKLLYN